MSIYFSDCPNPQCEHLYQRIGDPCKGCGEIVPGPVVPIPVAKPRGSAKGSHMTPELVAAVKACLEPCERCGQPMSSVMLKDRFPEISDSTMSRIRTGKYDHWLNRLEDS